MVGTSYAFFVKVYNGEKSTEVVAGTLKIEYKDGKEIELTNMEPTSDSKGMMLDSYDFSVENTGSLNGIYKIKLEEDQENTLDRKNIRYVIKEGTNEWSEVKTLENGLVLVNEEKLASGEKHEYKVKMWLDENVGNEVQGKTYKAKVVVEINQENAIIINSFVMIVYCNR